MHLTAKCECQARCAAIVHHGGAGTTQSSLLAGKPSVVVAHMADQPFGRSELKRLGVAGNTLWRKSLSAQKLAKEISSVLTDATMPEKALVIGKKMAREDGVKNAILLIERFFGICAGREQHRDYTKSRRVAQLLSHFFIHWRKEKFQQSALLVAEAPLSITT